MTVLVNALGKLIRLPLRLIPRDRVMTVQSGLNKGQRWIAGSSVHGCWIGTYERATQRLLGQLIKPGMVAWDVGANAGFYTLGLATRTAPKGRVYAFEPLAENADNLLAHLRMNRVANAMLIQTALGRTTDLVPFQLAPSNSMGFVASTNTGYMVPSMSADDFVGKYPEAMPQFIKVDIEGGESAMLEGAQCVLAAGPTILLSLHGKDQATACQRLLRLHGYTLYNMGGSVLDGHFDVDQICALRGPFPEVLR